MMSVIKIRARQFFIITFLTSFFIKTNLIAASIGQIPVRPSIRLGAPSKPVNGEHISLDFYNTLRRSEIAKGNLQGVLHNFLENLQKNLTTSFVLQIPTEVTAANTDKVQEQLQKLKNLSKYLETISYKARAFIVESKIFFETSRNESESLVSKMRQVPSAQHFLPREVKLYLTNYFEEMEYLQIVLIETIDEAMDYISTTLKVTEQTFLEFADRQRDIFRYLELNCEQCCGRFMDFLQQISPDILKCAAGLNLDIAYDVFATTAITIKYILTQLEFRIQKLFNCFLFGNYELRCRFLRNSEQDFEMLFDKIDELQTYYDVKIKKGRVSKTRSFDEELFEETMDNYKNVYKENNSQVDSQLIHNKCLISDFPVVLMPDDLKTCFE